MENTVVIDGRAHMYGRLASVVAKQLLSGQKIVVVRAEQMVISGSLVRNKVKYHQFLKKRHNTNPARGPFHYRSPARMFWRSVRGMVPQKTERGQLALARLSVFEGIPPPYDKQKRMVVPEALQVMRLAPGRRFCVVGRLATEVGWKYGDLVERLESKRKVESEAYYQTKKAAKAIREKAIKQADFSAVQPVLEQFGY